jgi:hypothetical protein
MIRLSKNLYKALDFATFKAECKIAEKIQALARKRGLSDNINWQFDSAFIDKKSDKVSAIYSNTAAPNDDGYNLTYSAKAIDRWQIIEFCSLDQH